MKNKNQFLDVNNESSEKEIRLLPFVLEFIPFLLFVYYGLNVFSIPFVVFALGSIYMFLGWYIFKSTEYNIQNTLITILAGITFAGFALSILLKVNSEPTAMPLMYGATTLGCLLCVFLSYRLYTKRNKRLEYRFSAKLISRLVPVMIIALNIIF